MYRIPCFLWIVLSAAFALPVAGAADQSAAIRQRLEALRRESASLQATIPGQLEFARKMDDLARQNRAEARACLNARPPRFSSAALFQSNARAAYAEARKARSAVSRARRRIQAIRAEIATLQRSLTRR